MFKKKSLGQHFLHEKKYLALIAESAAIARGESVLEIGPGEGALTDELIARGAVITAVEKDARLIEFLKNKYSDISPYPPKIIEGDILKHDISYFFAEGEEYKIVANIPYYITGAFLKKFLSAKHQPSATVLLIQKEVAQRIARSEKESILSLSVKAYGKPHYIQTVPAGAFSPPPQVDSAIIEISDISRGNFTDFQHEERFFELIKTGFRQKRKFLKRNLETVAGNKASDMLIEVGIDEHVRAEDVPLEKWLALSKIPVG